MTKTTFALAALAGAFPCVTSALDLQLPLDCTLGETCYIQQYVDHDPSEGSSDYACGALSYDGHKGTDFSVKTFDKMEAGVNVLAASAGVVRAVRDGMPDTGRDGISAAQLDGRECGNGLAIDHGDGWETQYCHLKRGSVKVQKGDVVNTGDVLGEVGFSGNTQFPHVHLSVRKDGAVVDPFRPEKLNSCGDAERPLWEADIAYTPAGVIDVGFDTEIPAYNTIKQGHGDAELRADAPIVFWAFAYGALPGDIMVLRIYGPEGEVVRSEVTIDKQQAQFFRAAGRKAPGGGWRSGGYEGDVTLIRHGKVLAQQAQTIRVP
ncbi:M23 family metallopeptidase [Donghicola tyrosinivorans]|uniref:Peptidase M23-like protein n=1 Tax=Donghicola tyrosinivorans TaxID=1652492 RepID=A0A2T0X0E8_9RHOB|nr:M23 family metallopeptidase [Donghicola tyrosinivorans]PRY92410.1 peptidase M23-like protein [Donghicola tyrosinivorans]